MRKFFATLLVLPLLLLRCNYNTIYSKGSPEEKIYKKYNKLPREYDSMLIEEVIAAHDCPSLRILSLSISDFEEQLIPIAYKTMAQKDLRSLALILSCGLSINYRDEIHGYTFLHTSVMNKNKEVTEFLLKHKANVHAKDWLGETPFHKAVNMNDPAIIKLLVAAKANGHQKNKAGKSPLDLVQGETLKEEIKTWLKSTNKS